jgi:hypothetical protein
MFSIILPMSIRWEYTPPLEWTPKWQAPLLCAGGPFLFQPLDAASFSLPAEAFYTPWVFQSPAECFLETQREKRGLWHDKNPIPPLEWRRGQGANAQVGPLSTTTPSLFQGNIKTFAFHKPECRHYDCESCMAGFGTREDALRAGYRPCRVCNP